MTDFTSSDQVKRLYPGDYVMPSAAVDAQIRYTSAIFSEADTFDAGDTAPDSDARHVLINACIARHVALKEECLRLAMDAARDEPGFEDDTYRRFNIDAGLSSADHELRDMLSNEEEYFKRFAEEDDG